MQSILRKTTVYLVIFAMVMTAAITLTAEDVQAAPKPKKITLTKAATYVDIGAKLKVSVKSTSPKSASKSVNWSISKGSKYGKLTNKAKSTVNVYGTKAGTVTVKATSKSAKKVSKTIKVTVKDLKATSLSLSAKTMNIGKGKTATLKATVKAPQKGVGYAYKATTWKSSDTAVATVNSKGVITAKALGKATITATNDGKSAQCVVTVPEISVLRAFTLVGDYSATKLNAVKVDKAATVQVWDKTTKEFEAGTKSEEAILGNFIQLEDDDADGDADIIKVVNREDSSDMWKENARWKAGAAAGKYPEITDAEAVEKYSKEYRIPFGERLLAGYGIGGYCGVNDYKDVADSPYWPTYDYYNLKSGNGLTILEGYKTTPQTTGSMCVMSSALTVLDWYGLRGDLNEHDLAALRGEDHRWGGGTSIYELRNVFETLDELDIAGTSKWVIEDTTNNDPDSLYNPDWIKGHLEEGHPIMVIWNSYGAHGQVIIGYDDGNTPYTADDQLIMMDPYDTTDHNNDGYTIQSYERLAYGTLSWDEVSGTKFLVAYPRKGWSYTPSDGAGLPDVAGNTIKSDDSNKLNNKLMDKTAKDLNRWYKSDIDPDGISHPYLGGAWAYERFADNDTSPFYSFSDFFNYENGVSTEPTATLEVLKNFKTVQQSTEWTCGTASAVMVMEWFGKNVNNETDASLGHMRQNGNRGATYLSGMEEIFEGLNDKYDQDWVTFDINDAVYDENDEANYIGDYALEWGRADGGLIPYLIDNGIPMMIGWDEWGGHWQVIVGYDDMDTPYQTQDDVLILADPYDTTDHDCDGYVVESFERLVYGWNANFEKDVDGPDYSDFIVAFPKAGNEDVITELGLQ